MKYRKYNRLPQVRTRYTGKIFHIGIKQNDDIFMEIMRLKRM